MYEMLRCMLCLSENEANSLQTSLSFSVPNLSERDAQTTESRDCMDLAVLIAVAVAKTKSMALLDRLAYALNPESVRMAVADALRVIQYDQVSRNPSIVQTIDESGHPIVKVRTEDRDEPIVIRGRLPSSEAVRRFIEEADPDLAKKVGVRASSLLVEALSEQEEDR
jgi:CRISPR type I-A-associated protein Csa5